jgi:hypothetical protein
VEIVALIIALVALIASLVAISLALIAYHIIVRTTFVNRDMERSPPQAAPGTYTGEQRPSTRFVDATEQPISSSFFSTPDIPPEALAPSLGRPPIPKGGFGTKVVVSKRE